MSSTRKLVILAAGLIGLTVVGSALSHAVLSRPLVDSDHIIFTDTYQLSAVADDALVVVADNVELSADSVIPDDAALVGRTQASLNGKIEGDLTLMGGDLTLGENANVAGDASFMGKQVTLNGQIDGDVVVISESLKIDPAAQIKGEVTACVSNLTDGRNDTRKVETCSSGPDNAQFTMLQSLRDGSIISSTIGGGSGGGFSGAGLLLSLLSTFSLTALSALAVALFPRHFSYLTEAVRAAPRSLAGVGCLTLLATGGVGAGVTLALAKLPVLGLLMLPVGLLIGVIVFAMVLTGWIALALLLGDYLVRRLVKHTLPPLITVVLGSAALFVLWYVLALLPFGAWFGLGVMALLGAVGLGATLSTVMGTRAMRRSYFVQG